MPDRVFNIIFENDEISWQTILKELVKSEQMNPWDIDVSLLAKRYIEMLKQMKEADLRVSGKVILAAALLLRIKATRLLEDEVSQFDALLEGEDETLVLDDEEMQKPGVNRALYKRLKLYPRSPQPRKRKVSIQDLLEALQKALNTKKRRLDRVPIVDVQIPEKKYDISQTMDKLFQRIEEYLKEKKKVKFSDLTPNDAEKMAKVYTFIPLVFLSNTGKIDLVQEEHFGEINILLHENEEAIEQELKTAE